MATNTTVVQDAGRQAEGRGRSVARGIRPAAARTSWRWSGSSSSSCCLFFGDLRAVPRAVAVPGAGPHGGLRQRQPAAAAVVAGPHPRAPTSSAATCSAGCSTARGSASPSRFVVQAVIILHRRADRRASPAGSAAATDNVLMRFTDVIYAFPDLLFIILLSVAFRETRVRPGARRPAPRLRRHRPRRLGHGRPA